MTGSGLRHTFRLQLLATCIALGAACGGGGTTPPTPTTPPPPTLSGLTITGLDALRTGFFSDYTATATLSDGSTQNVTTQATWSTGNASVATAEANGRISGQTHGSTTVTATYQGRTGSKAVNVVNNYGGTWTGTYIATACDAAGAFRNVGWCQGVVGSRQQITLVLSQTGNDRSSVSGRLSNQFITNAPVTGNVTGDGRLVLGSDSSATSNGVTFRFQLGGWDTRLTSLSQMSGRTAVNLSAINVSGNAYEEHTMNGVVLSNPQLTATREQ